MTMEPRSHRLIILLCVWCLLGAGRLLTVVNAQIPRVEVRLLTSDVNIREGGMVEMRCVGRDLQDSNYIVEWAIGAGNTQRRLRLGDVTEPGVTSRYTFETITSSLIILQYFNITDLRRNDSNVYTCNLYKYPRPEGGRLQIIDSDSVMLSVLYFPSETFPMCFPDGPITVHTGTELNMRCTSETGNPSVTMKVFTFSDNQSYYYSTGTAVNNSETISMSLNRTATAADENVTFACFISSASFPNRDNIMCTIGPITVRQDTLTTEQTLIAASTPSQQSASPSSPDIALIAGASAGGAVALLCAIALALVCLRRRRHSEKRTLSTHAPSEVKVHDRSGSLDIGRTDPKVSDSSVSGSGKQTDISPIPSDGQTFKNAAFSPRDADENGVDESGDDAVGVPWALVAPQPNKPAPYRSYKEQQKAPPGQSASVTPLTQPGGNTLTTNQPTHEAVQQESAEEDEEEETTAPMPPAPPPTPTHHLADPVDDKQIDGGEDAHPVAGSPPRPDGIASPPGDGGQVIPSPAPIGRADTDQAVTPQTTEADEDTESDGTEEQEPPLPRDQAPTDHLVYADLTLNPIPAEGSPIICTETPTDYATVVFPGK